MAMITFATTPFKIDNQTIVQLPASVSAKLPSRGMTVIQGTINGVQMQVPLEPDGKGSHWFSVSRRLQTAAKVVAGRRVNMSVEPTKVWPRPDTPEDLAKALVNAPQAHDLWAKITPNAQWEWIRWIRSTKQAQTRQKRIEVACSKLTKGMCRPCCFNRNICTDPTVSHNWVLRTPGE